MESSGERIRLVVRLRWEICDIQLFGGFFRAVSKISNRSSKFSATRAAEQFLQRKMNVKRIISSSFFRRREQNNRMELW